MFTVADGVDESIGDVERQCRVVGDRVNVVFVWLTGHVHQFSSVHFATHADLTQCAQLITDAEFT